MREDLAPIVRQVGRVVLGKERQVRLALACLFARGHLLIEDLPGIGKTTLAQALARSLGLDFLRVQFTSDLLPGDLLGVSVYDRRSGSFVYHPGPIFTQVLLADEINRTTPKTQSALLEAMEERQVTVEGTTRALEEPFFVVATQNPLDQSGTYPLPESQLDRFLMRLDLGYPDRRSEMNLLAGGGTRRLLAGLAPALQPGRLLAVQDEIASLKASDALLEYVLDIVAFTRTRPEFQTGLSPRAGMSLLQAARAWAYIEGRDFVLPEDVQAVLPWVAGHRLRSSAGPGELARDALTALLGQVPVP